MARIITMAAAGRVATTARIGAAAILISTEVAGGSQDIDHRARRIGCRPGQAHATLEQYKQGFRGCAFMEQNGSRPHFCNVPDCRDTLQRIVSQLGKTRHGLKHRLD